MVLESFDELVVVVVKMTFGGECVADHLSFRRVECLQVKALEQLDVLMQCSKMKVRYRIENMDYCLSITNDRISRRIIALCTTTTYRLNTA